MTIDNADNKAQKRRKVRAILASGLVLGVGAAVTLAAWNDSVWGNAQFGTGANTWNVQGDFGGGFNEYIENPGGSMIFTPGFGNLAPGQTVASLVGLRETGSNLDAIVSLQRATDPADVADGVSKSNLDETLLLKVTDMGATKGTCTDKQQTGDVLTGTTATVSNGTFANLTVPKGAERWLCFAVTLPNNLNPSTLSKSVSVAWEFQAVSAEPVATP
ncbi:SipW-dependent-type signal peptide-containing protein [Rhodococcus rhodochrous]|uniref:SipW-dependent-type signal peptide-containing protein n=1 Tax=Rhodococcus rhodochrous TaxID=1829 RepID=UPI00031CEBBD|nr:SipW-dependent-type signal peptide-containing protein [Rhodococcus rhodochrous]